MLKSTNGLVLSDSQLVRIEMKNTFSYRIRHCQKTNKYYADILVETIPSIILRLIFRKRPRSFVWKGIGGLGLTSLNDDVCAFDTEEHAIACALNYKSKVKVPVSETSIVKVEEL